MNNIGQLSLEYIFIFLILLIIFSIISVPLLTESMENTQDVSDVVKCKNTLSQLAGEVKFVYYSDEGTKIVKSIHIPKDMKIEYKSYNGRHYLSTNVRLNDNSTKNVMVEIPCKVTFKNNPNYYYTNVYNRWYYNVEFKWISSNKTSNVDINFK
ncbi:MAG: hypothetical protein Q4Q22_05920 [Methanosphaera sp.]|nr:hypothetical protein [Methanosphaera sp.]